MNKKFVILDRDGVINADSDAYIKCPDEWVALPGSLEAIATLNRAGYRVIVASNQSGLGRGLFNMVTLNAIHVKMHEAARTHGAHIDAIFFCPHTPHDHCDCRKPKPGLLQAIIDRFDIEAGQTPFAGDAQRDLEAAIALGFPAHLVLSGQGKTTQAALIKQPLSAHVHIHDDLSAFARVLVNADKPN